MRTHATISTTLESTQKDSAWMSTEQWSTDSSRARMSKVSAHPHLSNSSPALYLESALIRIQRNKRQHQQRGQRQCQFCQRPSPQPQQPHQLWQLQPHGLLFVHRSVIVVLWRGAIKKTTCSGVPRRQWQETAPMYFVSELILFQLHLCRFQQQLQHQLQPQPQCLALRASVLMLPTTSVEAMVSVAPRAALTVTTAR